MRQPLRSITLFRFFDRMSNKKKIDLWRFYNENKKILPENFIRHRFMYIGFELDYASSKPTGVGVKA